VRNSLVGLLALSLVGIAAAASQDWPTDEALSGGTLSVINETPSGCCKVGDTTPPLDLIQNTPKGQLANPYNDEITEVAGEGQKKYHAAGCGGYCHGGGGGGGICPPLTNQVWIYGSDDDTLFRLVALGTDRLQREGYSRKAHETVVGPMLPFGTIVKTSDDLWKIIAWIRAVNPSSLPAAVPQKDRL
jgi:hypothetical protein